MAVSSGGEKLACTVASSDDEVAGDVWEGAHAVSVTPKIKGIMNIDRSALNIYTFLYSFHIPNSPVDNQELAAIYLD
jgi:hypothetical protein